MKAKKRANQGLSRRDFVKGATVGAGAAAMTSLGPVVGHSEASGGEIAQSPIKAIEECDVAVVGLGISGMVAALHAAELGAKVVAMDKAPAGDWIRREFHPVNSSVPCCSQRSQKSGQRSHGSHRQSNRRNRPRRPRTSLLHARAPPLRLVERTWD